MTRPRQRQVVVAGLAAVASACSGTAAKTPTGDAPGASCGWASSPQLARSQSGAAPSNLFANGDTVYSGWLSGGANPTGSLVVATHLPDLQSSVVVQRPTFMTLLGVSADGLYVGESDENATWTSLELLHRDGSPGRQIATVIGGQPISGPQLRVGATLYAISGNMLYAEHDGAWAAVADVGAVSRFVDSGSDPLLVIDASQSRVCVVDEAAGRAQPCVDIPVLIDGTTQVYNIDRAGFANDQWALVGLTDAGDALLVGSGTTWQSVAVTHNQWTINGVAPRAPGWMWLRQESVDQNTYRTSAVTDAGELWVVDGQAFQPTATQCGTMFAVQDSGLYAVAR